MGSIGTEAGWLALQLALQRCRYVADPLPPAAAAALTTTLPLPSAWSVQPKEARYRSFRTRFVSSIVLIASFLLIIWAGHVPLMFMVLGIQVGAGMDGWVFVCCRLCLLICAWGG